MRKLWHRQQYSVNYCRCSTWFLVSANLHTAGHINDKVVLCPDTDVQQLSVGSFVPDHAVINFKLKLHQQPSMPQLITHKKWWNFVAADFEADLAASRLCWPDHCSGSVTQRPTGSSLFLYSFRALLSFLFPFFKYFFFFSLSASATSSFHHHVSLCLHGPFDNPHVRCAASSHCLKVTVKQNKNNLMPWFDGKCCAAWGRSSDTSDEHVKTLTRQPVKVTLCSVWAEEQAILVGLDWW